MQKSIRLTSGIDWGKIRNLKTLIILGVIVMKKFRYGLMAVLVLMTWSFAVLAEDFAIFGPETLYNGDKVSLRIENAPTSAIQYVFLLKRNADVENWSEYQLLDHQNLSREGNQIFGELEVKGLDENDSKATLWVVFEDGTIFTYGSEFAVVGNAPEPMSVLAGTFTITDNDGGLFGVSDVAVASGSGFDANEPIFFTGFRELNPSSSVVQTTTPSSNTLSVDGSGNFSGNATRNGSAFHADAVKIDLLCFFGGSSGSVVSSNQLLIAETNPPDIVSATATSLNTIQVVFDEGVSEVGGEADGNISLSGSDASGLTVLSFEPSGTEPTTTWTLTLSGNLPDKDPNITVTYVRTGGAPGNLEDAAGNEVTDGSNAIVADGIAPTTPVLTSPTSSTIISGSLTLTATADASSTDGSMAGVRFEGSNNGSSWSAIGTDSDVSDGTYQISYNLSTKYSFYRAVALDDNGNESTSSATDNLSDAYRIKATSVESPVNAGETAAITIQIQNNYTDAATLGFNSTYSLSSNQGTGTFYSDDAGTNPITSINISSGSSSVTFYYADTDDGTTPTITVTETGGNLDDPTDSFQIAINASTVDHFHVATGNGQNETAGVAFDIIVTAHKADHTTATDYVGSHSLTWSTTATASPDGTSPSIPSNGNRTFSAGGLTITKGGTLYNSAETPNITVTDGTVNTSTSEGAGQSITVNDAPAAEVIIKSQADGGEGEYSNNIFTTATYQGATQADPDASVQLFAEVYDQFGNRTTGSTYSWSGTGDFTGSGVISFSDQTVFNPTITFVGTANTVYTGTLSVTVNSSFSDATGTITVDNSPPAQVSGFNADNPENDETVVFTWNPSSSGDDGTSGSISSFQIRWATEAAGPIDNETKWNAATTAFTGNPTQWDAGARNVDMSGFPSGNKYFAIRTFDDVGNKSAITFTTSTDFSLPVTLTSFVATAGYGQVVLKWVTASELNNEGFFVYRATNEAGPYTDLLNQQIIPGRGTTNEATEYEFVDKNVAPGNTYYYKLISRDFNGTIHESPMRASATVLELPKSFELAQNYPNPFNPTTHFSFTLAQAGTVSLEVYNILGQKIRTIVENEFLEPGVYDGSYQWDATDDAGNVVSGGIYYYVFTVKENNFRKVRKMVFLK
jgi:hypothetical protein